MYIEKLSIVSFGTLKNKEYIFSNDLNIVEGQNESGKTTLMNFVLFVLYGTDSTINKRMKSAGEAYTGRVTLTSEKLGRVIVSRTASATGAKVSDDFTVTSCETLKEINIGKTAPGEYILGVNRDFFENSVFVSQSGASKYDAGSMNIALQNILNSANEKMSTEKGKRKLDETRKNLKHKNNKGGAIYTVSQELSQLEAELDSNKNGRILLAEAEERISKLRDESKALDAIPALISDEKKARCVKKLCALKEQYAELEGEESEKTVVFDKLQKTNSGYRSSDPIGTLHKYDLELKMANAKAEMLEANLALAKTQYETLIQKQQPIPDKIDEYIDKIRNYRDDIKRLLYGAISAFVIAAIIISLGVICVLNSEFIAAAALLLCALGASIFGFVILSSRKKQSDLLVDELTALGFSTDISLREIKDETERRIEFERTRQAKKDEIDHISESVETEYELYDKNMSELKELLMKLAPENEDMPLDLQILRAETMINNCFDAETRIKHEIDEIAYRKKILLSEISAYKVYSGLDTVPNPTFAQYSDSELDEHLQYVIKRKNDLSDEIRQLSIQITSLENRLRPESDIEAEILEKRDLLKLRQEQFEIVSLAQEALDKASNNIRSAVTPNIIKICDELFSKVTCGRYDHIGVDPSLALNGISGEEARAEGELSYGTNEAMYLVFRLSLCSVLCQNEMPPLMFDETFAHIDDSRTYAIMKMLSEHNAQTILFTCSKREAHIAKEKGLKPNIIML